MQNVTINAQDTTNSTNIYGTIGMTAVPILAAIQQSVTQQQRIILLQIHNPSNSNFLAVTHDGTTPGVFGVGYTIAPLATYVLDTVIPQGPLTMIGSAASCPYTITYM